MNNASAQPAPTTEHASDVSMEAVRQFVNKWAPSPGRRSAFVMDLGVVISAVGSQIVRAANGDGETR